MNEPGVLKLEPESAPGKRKRLKLMYRIPESVAERIVRRATNVEPRPVASAGAALKQLRRSG